MTLKCSIARVAPSCACCAGAHIVDPSATATNTIEITTALNPTIPLFPESLLLISISSFCLIVFETDAHV
jgi:hypothetical protein